MGRRDDKLTAAEEAAADRAMRALLGQRSEPTALPPPPNLVERSMARLPHLPPAAARRAEGRRALRRRSAAWGSAFAMLLLSSLGLWGILVNSNGPALLFGGPDTRLGEVALIVTLAAKPLVALLLSLSTPSLLVGALAVLACGWLWWRLAARPLAPLAVELP